MSREVCDPDPAAWVGRQEQAVERLGPTPPRALAATLDHPAQPFDDGTLLPPLWHWLYFLPLHRARDIGADGHARLGGFLPPLPLPRRMWAGSRFVFQAPLRVGDIVTRRSTLESVQPKSGRRGPLVFVTVRHELSTADGPALTEWHDIVYRPAPVPGEAQRPNPPGTRRGAMAAIPCCPTTCCCSATARSPSTATASTTTGATSPRSRLTRAWSCTGR
jgi:3-methylfumaryl-CoA hydratase